METLDELFTHELQDIYSAENMLVDALQQMASESKSREIKSAFTGHKKETQNQIKRLRQVFKAIGAKAEDKGCPGMEGLIKEKKALAKQKPSQHLLEFANLGAGQKSERYEITAYENLIEMAGKLGLDEAIELLRESLQEEENALNRLKMLASEYDLEGIMPLEEEEMEGRDEEQGMAMAAPRTRGRGRQ